MKINDFIKNVSIMAALALSASVFAAESPPPVSLTPAGTQLEAQYSKMLADLKEAIKALEPKVDEKKKAEFTKRVAALGDVPPVTKTVMGKEVTVKHGPDNLAFVEKQKEALAAARVVMKDIESFLGGGKEQAIMAKFALLTHATPNRLAGFAQKGDEEKALIDKLLNDDKLVVQAMTMEGASGGNYGQAMRNYTAIQKATERSHEGFFQVWALAASLQYTDETYIYPDVPAAESLVKYYLNYLKAYDAGVLDPAFSKLGGTGWDYRFVFPDDYTLEDIDWVRNMIRNYRPDHTRRGIQLALLQDCQDGRALRGRRRQKRHAGRVVQHSEVLSRRRHLRPARFCRTDLVLRIRHTDAAGPFSGTWCHGALDSRWLDPCPWAWFCVL